MWYLHAIAPNLSSFPMRDVGWADIVQRTRSPVYATVV
jgi:hypothetical protein